MDALAVLCGNPVEKCTQDRRLYGYGSMYNCISTKNLRIWIRISWIWMGNFTSMATLALYFDLLEMLPERAGIDLFSI